MALRFTPLLLLLLLLTHLPACLLLFYFLKCSFFVLSLHLTLSLLSTLQCIPINTTTTTTALLREGRRAAPLSPTTIRVLYSLQLEMDSTLPIKVAAQCRLWAEEKYVRHDTCAMMCPILLDNVMMMYAVNTIS